ncbi:protein phsophatase-2A, putative, partial [Entamoeba invadens IP1]
MDVDECITQIKHGCLLPDHTILELCFLSKSLLCLESNVVAITSPVTVCGCIHGQLHDLLHLIEINGQLPDVQYLFLGNYVGRGAHQIETVCLLLLMKVKYPDRIHLLRGNHETWTMSQSYGLYDECIKKYGSTHCGHSSTVCLTFSRCLLSST